MRVEIDVSDIPFGSYYTDERCKRVERIIQEKEEYTEFRVKRYRREEDSSMDIYVIMDATENYWVWMYEWEVDELTDSEIISYVTVTKETSQKPDPTENYMIIMCLFIALLVSFIIVVVVLPEYQTNPGLITIILALLIFSFISGWIYKRKYKAHMQSEREFEKATMTRYPLFLESIRKFAILPDIGESQREIYLERIQEIESKMVD